MKVDARRKKVGVKGSEDELRRLAAVARLNHKTVPAFIRDAINNAAAECTDEPVFLDC